MTTTPNTPSDPDSNTEPELQVVTDLRPFRFEKRPISIEGDQPGQMLALEPLPGHPTDIVAVDENNSLYRINLRSGHSKRIATLTPEQLRAEGPLALVLSRDHAFAAVTRSGSTSSRSSFNAGQVVDLETGACIFALDCGDYIVHLTPFPVNFVEHEGRTLVIHATNWDRVDISDPRTGRCLTERDMGNEDEDEDPDAPVDSVFTEWHGELLLSPDQTHIATIGWAWHPVGIAFSWSVSDWLAGNASEPDDGSSRRSHSLWNGFWDSPFFWYDDRTLCIWGDADRSSRDGIPPDSVVLYDADTSEVIRTFDGPTMDYFYFDQYLFSGIQGEDGVSIWDLDKGALLHEESGIKVRAYHPGLREFLEIEGPSWSAWHWQEI